MADPQSVPFTALCARLGAWTTDGRLLVPSKANESALEASRGIPVIAPSPGGPHHGIGTVDLVEVVWGAVVAHGRIWRAKLGYPHVRMMAAGEIHLNPDIGWADVDALPDGRIVVWDYPLRALTCKGPSAWADIPRVRMGW